MSCIYHEDNKQNIYEKNLDEVSKRIKDIPTAEKEARILTEKELEDNQWIINKTMFLIFSLISMAVAIVEPIIGWTVDWC